MVFKYSAQELGDGENILGVADLLKDASIEPLGEEQDAFLVTCRTEAPAFTRVGENRLVVAAAASKAGEAAMKVTTVKVFTQNLADNLAPGSILKRWSRRPSRRSRSVSLAAQRTCGSARLIVEPLDCPRFPEHESMIGRPKM